MGKTKYEGLNYKDPESVLGAGTAYVQAAQALDVAAESAVQSGDRDTLTTVAALWIKIAESLLDDDAPEEGEEEHHESCGPAGFMVPVREEEDGTEVEGS